jgi:hypothetical protein
MEEKKLIQMVENGLKGYVQTLAKNARVIHFSIPLEGNLDTPIIIEDAIFILPLPDNRGEVFIYPKNLDIEIAKGLKIDLTPIADYLKQLSVSQTNYPNTEMVARDEDEEEEYQESEELVEVPEDVEEFFVEEKEEEQPQTSQVKRMEEVEIFEEDYPEKKTVEKVGFEREGKSDKSKRKNKDEEEDIELF